MLSLSPATRVFLAVQPIDGRKGFNGLYSLVKATLQQEPTSGFLFVFLTKRRNRLKILTYDGSGLWLLTNSLVSIGVTDTNARRVREMSLGFGIGSLGG